MIGAQRAKANVGPSLDAIPYYLARPLRLLGTYRRANLRPDLLAGLTVAVILLPQAIAFALIAELPPEMGIYTAVIAGIVGALWGSSNQNHTGPTNAMSLLVLSVLLTSYLPGTPEFILAAGLLAMMAGGIQLIMGLARLGMLVNFVSHSVIVGFATGAGVLIAIRQVPSLLGLSLSGENIVGILLHTAQNLPQINMPTAALGVGSIVLIVALHRINPKLPAALLAMAASSLLVVAFDLTEQGVAVIGQLPQKLPPLTELPIKDLGLISGLVTGALAVAAIGLVETTAISRSIATRTGQRLDSNQEFVGQGLANIAVGLFSGYPCAGSFSRSAVNFDAGARTPVAAVFSSAFVLVAMFAVAPLAIYLPRAALSGVLIVVAFGMIDRSEIVRIWGGARGDALIMLITFLGTLFLEIAVAVLLGILLSFALYIMRTSTPRVHQVLPDRSFKHFTYQPDQDHCPQLGVIDILGDLYFGAVSHVEETIHQYAEKYAEQRFLLVRMHNVNHCDFSGIHMLESVINTYRERGGDVYMVRVSYSVDKLMVSTGFTNTLGGQNFLPDDTAIDYLFHRVLDPAVCIYECPVRVFIECQNLPKRLYAGEDGLIADDYLAGSVAEIEPARLWQEIRGGEKALTVIDVREPREFRKGHIPGAQLVPLPSILSGEYQFVIAGEHRVVLVCRSGRRSRRAAQVAMNGSGNFAILRGGMLAWEAAGLLSAVE